MIKSKFNIPLRWVTITDYGYPIRPFGQLFDFAIFSLCAFLVKFIPEPRCEHLIRCLGFYCIVISRYLQKYITLYNKARTFK